MIPFLMKMPAERVDSCMKYLLAGCNLKLPCKPGCFFFLYACPLNT